MSQTKRATSPQHGRGAIPRPARTGLNRPRAWLRRSPRRAAAALVTSAVALAGLLLLMLALTHGTQPAAQAAPADPLLSGSQVIAAFRQAGLPVENVREDPLGSSPSGPPATEREAWSFAIPSVAPSGGRVMVFADDQKLQQKAAWFRRAGATVAVHRNVILWLHPDLDPNEAARYRQVLQQVG